MKHKTRNLALLAATLLLGACHDVELADFSFNASVEQLSTDDKVQLVNENFVYWEQYDRISVGTDLNGTNAPIMCDLVNFGGSPESEYSSFNGVFIGTLPLNSTKFVGLFPHSADNVVEYSGGTFSKVQVQFPADQPVRNDLTFSRDGFPMVAYCGDAVPYRLNFHTVAGIVRLQFFSSVAGKSLRSVTVTEVSATPKALSGAFDVHDFSTYNPYVTPSATAGATSTTVTLTASGDGIPISNVPSAGVDTASLRSLYLILPAVDGGSSHTTTYNLSITLTNTDGESAVIAAPLSVKVRRSGITYVRAVCVDEWSSASGNVSGGIVGNGTEARPFKIYSVADLQHIRKAFKTAHESSTTPVINGQAVTYSTVFRVMRPDIVLTTDNWTEGIVGFAGKMTYYTTAGNPASTNTPGITNNSSRPIFESVSADGQLIGLPVLRSGSSVAWTSGADATYLSTREAASSLCYENNGTISDCRFMAQGESADITMPEGKPYSGICAVNNGTIKNSGCAAIMTIRGPNTACAGVCGINNGTISGCYAASPMKVYTATIAAGVCYSNAGYIADSYFACSMPSTTSAWGGVVYTNSGTVTHCYSSGEVNISTSRTVGGIVNTLTGGLVDKCRSNATLKGTLVGGIVADMQGGLLLNSYSDAASTVVTVATDGTTGGGIIGRVSGSSEVYNCYCNISAVGRSDNTTPIAGFVGIIDGTEPRLNNCYAYENNRNARKFYGEADHASQTVYHCYVVDLSEEQDGVNLNDVSLGVISPRYDDVDGDESSSVGKLLSVLTSNRSSLDASHYYVAWKRVDGVGLPVLDL